MNVPQINISLELYSILISLLMIVFLLLWHERNNLLNRLFLQMLIINTLVLSCDLFTWIYDITRADSMEPFLAIVNFGVYAFGYLLLAIFTQYLVAFISARATISKRIWQVIFILCLVAIVLLGSSHFTHMFYYFDENYQYHRGPYHWFSQLYPIVLILCNTVIVCYHRKDMSRQDFYVLVSYAFLPMVAMVIQIYMFGITLLYISTTVSMLIIYVSIQMEQSHLLRQKELELANSRINIMLSQIQPHFLYNALTAICQLCDEDPAQAKRATTEFAFFLRSNMDSLTQTRPIAFERELEHVRNYLSLEQKRFGEKLRVIYDIQAHNFQLPALSLQPIVENAVHYGVTKSERGGTITIRTEETAEAFRVIVSDDGIGFDPALPHTDGRTHIGIENVTNRLRAMCGGDLAIESITGIGTIAAITIPKVSAP